MSKKISSQALTGQLGVNLIERIILEMGFTWTPTAGGFDAGIDGYIEIRDPETHIATNQIIQVQSKATIRAFRNETSTTFDYLCEPRDIEYWMGGNTPVLLIVSHPETGCAYWKSVKTYLSDPAQRASRRIRFDKARDRFTSGCRSELVGLATSRDLGLYLSPRPKAETLVSNLLPVRYIAPSLYIAPAKYPTNQMAWDALRRCEMSLHGQWFVKGGEVISLRPFTDDEEWAIVAEPKRARLVDSRAWASTDEPVLLRDHARVLNLALRSHLPREIGHRYLKGDNIYYFRPSEDVWSSRKYTYQARTRRSTITVYKSYLRMRDEKTIGYCRAHAFIGSFHRFDGDWFLEIVPTYRFTGSDGKSYPWADECMKRIKELEKHAAVLSQVRMWSDIILHGEGPLLRQRRRCHLEFSEPLAFAAEVGIHDEAWQRTLPTDESVEEEVSEEDAPTEATSLAKPAAPSQLSLFGSR